MRRLMIPLFIVALGVVPTELRAAASQSLHFPVGAPSAAGAGGDDLRVGMKATGLPTIGSGSIDILTLDSDLVIARQRAGKEACNAAVAKLGSNCSIVLGTPATCLAYDTNQTIVLRCLGNGANGFDLTYGAGSNQLLIGAVGGGGNITHLTADNRGVYTDLGVDIAPRSLIQIRPNGLTGTIQIKIFHTQGGTNPRIANVTLDASNNDPSEALALHTAIKTALENISPPLSPAISVSLHGLNDVNAPLTAFAWLKQATSFAQITNIQAVGITEVEIVTPAGAAFTIEGTENTIDATTIPTLSSWGAILAIAVLLLMILWMHRRRMRLQQA